MTVVIKVNGVDKSGEIDYRSVSLNRAITNQADTLNFSVRRPDSGGFKPVLLDVIEVIEDGVTIFGGQIIEIGENVSGLLEYTECTAKDYSFDMDRKLVIKVYENMTVNDIIGDISSNYLTGYDTTNVNCLTTIKYIAFNYEFPSKCLQQLAQLVGYDWYVNQNKEIYFFLNAGNTAPFNLTDTNGKYVYKTLEISRDIKNLRNSIIVRGGQYVGDLYNEDTVADGDQITFLQAYQYSNIDVSINGAVQTVGVDGIDDPTLFDCLYNFQEKAVKFTSTTKPVAGKVVRVEGYPYYPVITKVTNPSSISQYGEFQYKIVDKSINSKEGARDRARAEITQWALEINEGSFTTMEVGLDTGQKITIDSAIRGINADYVISRINSRMFSPSRFSHNVTLVTAQTYGVIEFLSSLLTSKDKQITINQNEVLDYITTFSDKFTITDSISTPEVTTGPYLYNSAAWNFATWS